MKQLIITALFVAFSQLLNAQTDLYFTVKKLIAANHPEIVTDNKLIAFNVWSANDAESREANKAFDKVYKIYEYARLKGGEKGIVVVSFNKEELSSTATIAITRDGITKLISLKLTDLGHLSATQIKNIVFNSTGNTVYKDLPAAEVFTSINQLITR